MKDYAFKLTVIVPTYNRPQMLRDCLESIVHQSPNFVDLFVIDQSENTESYEVCKNYTRINYEHFPIKNKSAAVNHVIKKSCNPYISIVDDDCILDSNWVNVLVNSFSSGKYKVVQGKIIAGQKEHNSEESRLNDVSDKQTIIKSHIITPIFKIGCNFAVEREVFNVIGLFDTNFGPGSVNKSSDDNEWGYRLLKNGYAVLYEPQLKLTHRSWRNIEEDLLQMSDYGYAIGAFLKKMRSISKLDYLYHSTLIKFWILKNKTKFLFNKKRKPFDLYGRMLKEGFRNYST